MPRRVTPAQLQSAIRQAQAKQRSAVNQYNAAARKYNAEVKRAVDQHNAGVRRNRQAVDSYNREVTRHNARVRADRQRLQREIARIDGQRARQLTVSQTSTFSLHQAYRQVEDDFDAGLFGDNAASLIDLAEAEAANSAQLANALVGESEASAIDLDAVGVAEDLGTLSEDLSNRWRGAIFALNPANPNIHNLELQPWYSRCHAAGGAGAR